MPNVPQTLRQDPFEDVYSILQDVDTASFRTSAVYGQLAALALESRNPISWEDGLSSTKDSGVEKNGVIETVEATMRPAKTGV